jgi:hypothetical protein
MARIDRNQNTAAWLELAARLNKGMNGSTASVASIKTL